MKGYTMQKTVALPLHALTVSLPIQYNSIHSRVKMLYFIGGVPWVRNTVGQHTSQKNFLGVLPLNPLCWGAALNPKVGGMSV